MVTGSCLCGGVRFEVGGPISWMGNCHCPDCRKAYGSAFGTVAVCQKADFRYLAGEDLIGSYRQSERITRYFCRNCGSPIPIRQDWDPLVGIPAGLLDDDPEVKPALHIFVSMKAPWWDITDDRPQFAEYPPGGSPADRTDVVPPGCAPSDR
ncbi:GFA family protein [Candidatus Latescibacterota bacterium]